MEERVEIWFTEGTPEADMECVADLFIEQGIPAEPHIQPHAHPGIGNGFGWHVAAAIMNSGLSAFLARYFGAAGADAWRQTKAFVGKLRELELRDDETGAHVFLRSAHPDEAFRKLYEIDFEPDTWYDWDDDEGEWATARPGHQGFKPTR